MKTIIFALLIAVSTPTLAAIKCVNTPKGTCCWDTEKDGPFKPVGC
jgi:hypothetical protein